MHLKLKMIKEIKKRDFFKQKLHILLKINEYLYIIFYVSGNNIHKLTYRR